VERRINAVTYVIKRLPAEQPLVADVDKLKPYNGDCRMLGYDTCSGMVIKLFSRMRHVPNEETSDVSTRQTLVETALNSDSCVPHEFHTESSVAVSEKNAPTIESADENFIDLCVGRVKKHRAPHALLEPVNSVHGKRILCALFS
jgi:hypothetical protein